jgi:GNAT superfamily N-acetyltransferase
MGDERDLVAPRFARGCQCFSVIIDGAVAGYGWFSTSPEWIGELQLEIRPAPGEGYIWNCATLAEHRQKGVFRSLLVGILEIARKEGLKRLWIGSVAIPAEKALAPSGFQPVLRFSAFRFAGLQWTAMRESTSTDPRLIASARKVLGLRERNTKVEISIRRLRPRRH